MRFGKTEYLFLKITSVIAIACFLIFSSCSRSYISKSTSPKGTWRFEYIPETFYSTFRFVDSDFIMTITDNSERNSGYFSIQGEIKYLPDNKFELIGDVSMMNQNNIITAVPSMINNLDGIYTYKIEKNKMTLTRENYENPLHLIRIEE